MTAPADPLLDEMLARVRAVLGADLETATVTRGVIGLYFTAVALSLGTAGACATPPRAELHPACCPATADTVFPPATLAGRRATELLAALDSPHGLRRAVAIATLHALGEACWRRQPDPAAELMENTDAFDAAALAPGEHVVLVGAFIPFLRALKQRRQPYTVLERTPAMLKAEEMPHYRPAGDAPEVLARADVALITASTLLDGALSPLLAACPPHTRVVVTGPTAGLIAAPFFARGVDLLGGIRITEPTRFLDVLAEGGSGQHFFGKSAQRVVLRPAA